MLDLGATSLHGRPTASDDRLRSAAGPAGPARRPTPRAGVLLLDVVLGHGAHPDPASELAPAIRAALHREAPLTVVMTLVGTPEDPQGFERQATAWPPRARSCTRPMPAAARHGREDRASGASVTVCSAASRGWSRSGRRAWPTRWCNRRSHRSLSTGSPRARHRGGAGPGVRRRTAGAGQRAGGGPDARRRGVPGRRPAGRRGGRAGPRPVRPRGAADRLGAGERTHARCADRRDAARVVGRLRRSRPSPSWRRAGSTTARRSSCAVPRPRRRGPDGGRGVTLDVGVGAGRRHARQPQLVHPQRGAGQGAALRGVRARGHRAAALDGRGARPRPAPPGCGRSGQSTSGRSSARWCRWATRATTATGPAP